MKILKIEIESGDNTIFWYEGERRHGTVSLVQDRSAIVSMWPASGAWNPVEIEVFYGAFIAVGDSGRYGVKTSAAQSKIFRVDNPKEC